MEQELLTQIERFLKESGMSATAFGTNAMKNPHFVHRLRKGQRCWPDTHGTAVAYMRRWRQANEHAA